MRHVRRTSIVDNEEALGRSSDRDVSDVLNLSVTKMTKGQQMIKKACIMAGDRRCDSVEAPEDVACVCAHKHWKGAIGLLALTYIIVVLEGISRGVGEGGRVVGILGADVVLVLGCNSTGSFSGANALIVSSLLSGGALNTVQRNRDRLGNDHKGQSEDQEVCDLHRAEADCSEELSCRAPPLPSHSCTHATERGPRRLCERTRFAFRVSHFGLSLLQTVREPFQIGASWIETS